MQVGSDDGLPPHPAQWSLPPTGMLSFEYSRRTSIAVAAMDGAAGIGMGGTAKAEQAQLVVARPLTCRQLGMMLALYADEPKAKVRAHSLSVRPPARPPGATLRTAAGAPRGIVSGISRLGLPLQLEVFTRLFGAISDFGGPLLDLLDRAFTAAEVAARTHARTCARTHMRTHARAHTHTRTRARALRRRWRRCGMRLGGGSSSTGRTRAAATASTSRTRTTGRCGRRYPPAVRGGAAGVRKSRRV
jgi:hypothetical protein